MYVCLFCIFHKALRNKSNCLLWEQLGVREPLLNCRIERASVALNTTITPWTLLHLNPTFSYTAYSCSAKDMPSVLHELCALWGLACILNREKRGNLGLAITLVGMAAEWAAAPAVLQISGKHSSVQRLGFSCRLASSLHDGEHCKLPPEILRWICWCMNLRYL